MGFKSFLNRNRKNLDNRGSLEQEIQKVSQRQEVLEKEVLQQTMSVKEKTAYIPYGSEVPSGCKYYLGYLYKRPEKSGEIPEDCIVCLEVVDCLINQ